MRRKAQLVRGDPYGKEETERWAKEIDYFITHHIYPLLTDGEQALLNRERRASIALMISDRTKNKYALRIRFSVHFQMI